MSTDIEQRVVQMKFDNEGFEKGANQTIKTLNNLDQALSFKNVDKGLTNFQNATKNITSSMKSTISSLEQTAKKYSWFEQIAIGAYRKVGEAATSYLSRQVLELTGLSRATEGWRKYEQEIEATQRIMNAANKTMAEVEPILEDISIFSDETSYSYESMVDAMGKFNAAGVKDLDLTKNAMFGIANMAGYFGVNATDATHAMEGFAKAMGKGKMDSLSWHWIETAHMNTMGVQQAFIDAAVAAGTLKKTGEDMYEVLGKKNSEFSSAQFKESLKYGWLNQDAMLKAFGKYSVAMDDLISKFKEMNGEMSMAEIIDEYGDSFDQFSVKAFEAGQQTRTFTDLLGALSTNAASAWRKTFRYIFGNYEESKELWGNVSELIWDAFSKQGTERNGILKLWYEGLGGETESGRTMLFEALTNIWQGFQNILAPIRDAWDAVFPSDVESKAASLIAITEKFRDITASFRSWFAPIGDVMERVTGNIDKAKESVEEFIGPVARTEAVLDQLVDEVWAGKWGTYWDRWNALEAAGYSWQLVQNAVNASVGNMKRYEVIADKVVATQQDLAAAVEDSNEAIYDFGSDESAARANRLFRIFRGLFEGFKMMKTLATVTGRAIGYVFSRVGSALAPLGDIILEVLATGGDKIHEFYENLGDGTRVFDKIKTRVDVFSKKLREGLDKIIVKGHKLKEMFVPMLSNLTKSIVPRVIDGFEIVKKYFGQFYNWISPKVVKGVDFISEFFTKLWKKIGNGEGFSKLKKTFTDLWGVISNVLSSMFGVTMETGGKLGNNIKNFFGSLLGFEDMTNVSWADLFVTAIDKIAGALSDLISWIGPATERLKSFFGIFKKDEAQEFGEIAGTVERSMGSVERSVAGVERAGKSEGFKGFTKVLEDFLNFFKGISETLQSPWKKIREIIDTTYNSIAKLFEGFDINNLGENMKNGGLGVLFGVLAKKLLDTSISITQLPSTLNGVLMGLHDVLVAYASNINSMALMTIAKAIGILTLSVIGLCAIEPTKLTDVVSALAIAGMVLGVVVKAMGALYEGLAKYRLAKNDKLLIEDAQKTNEALTKSAQTVADGITGFGNILMAPFKTFLTSLSTSIDKKLNSQNFARSFLTISIALGILVGIIWFIKKENWTLAADSIGDIIVFLAGVTALMWAFVLTTKATNGVQSIGTALSYLTMAEGLYILVGVIEEIMSWLEFHKDIDVGKAVAIMAAMAIFMSAFALCMAAMKDSIAKNKKEGTIEKTTSKPIKMLIALLGFILAIKMLLPIFAELGALPIEEFWRAIVLLGVFLAALWGFTNILAQSGQKGAAEAVDKGIKQMYAIVGLIAAIGLVLTGMTVLVNQFGGGVDKVLMTIGMITLAMFALVGLGLVIKHLEFGDSLVKFGDGMAKMGIGLVLGAAGIYVLAKAIPELINAVVAIGEVMTNEDLSKKFVAGITVILLAVLAAIIECKTKIFSTMFEWLISGIEAFKTVAPKALKKVLELVNTITGFVKKHKWAIYGAIAFVLVFAFGLINQLIPGLVENLFRTFTLVLYSLAKTVLSQGGRLLDAIWSLAKAIAVTLFTALSKSLQSLLGSTKIGKWIAEKMQIDTVVDESAEVVKKEMSALDGKIAEIQKENAKPGSDSMQASAEYGEAMANETSDSYNETMEENQNNGGFQIFPFGGDSTNAFDIFDKMPDAVKEKLDLTKLTQANSIQYLVDMWKQYSPETYNAAKLFGEQGKEGVSDGMAGTKEEVKKSIDGTGEAVADEFEWGLMESEVEIDEGKIKVRNALADLVSNYLLPPLANGAEKTGDIGENAVRGLIAGMTRKEVISKLSSTAVYVSNVMLRGMKSKQGLYEQSPSHKTFKFGEFAVLGLVNGALALIPKVFSTGQMVGDTMSSAISDAMAFASDAFSQDLDYSPTITPLVNLNDVKNSVSALDSLFSPRALAVADEAVAKQLRNRQYNLEQQQYATEALNSALAKLDNSMQVEAERSYDFNIPVVINGREVAKASATYTRAELNRIDKLEGRKGGKV